MLIHLDIGSQVLAGMYKLEKSGFRQIFKLTKVEWCAFMAGTTKSNYMINLLVSTIKDSTSKELFHKCPYEGKIELMKISMKNDKLFSIIPSGNYKIRVEIMDGNSAGLFTVELVVDLHNEIYRT